MAKKRAKMNPITGGYAEYSEGPSIEVHYAANRAISKAIEKAMKPHVRKAKLSEDEEFPEVPSEVFDAVEAAFAGMDSGIFDRANTDRRDALGLAPLDKIWVRLLSERESK